ncbi:FCD domain-containing protein [Defluviimonas sp. WL0002]|uniref:FCD domain-containing protein n=1 Tax=Albidovulum marisflavi TaxID=2984159 RepID=A0ABT2ZES7_9RHOB|nr:FCD domain-containing protein [Defluviimonas sp. WL0002]MCV2869634.1 FCD domain-containing protein [Defluviimonas sp. WL0002]
MHPRTESGLVGQDVYRAIRRDIIFGQLEAGAKLRLEKMKASYGASVSTIREALSRLVTEGLVEAAGQRGFSVAGMSDTELREIADLRILVESHALGLSIAAGDTEWEGAIVAAHHKLSRMEERMAAGDMSVRETWKQYDWEFHQALILACGSRALMEVHGTIFDKYLRYQMRRLTYRGETASAEHRALLEAALDRNALRAQEILRTHIEGGVAHSLSRSVVHGR